MMCVEVKRLDKGIKIQNIKIINPRKFMRFKIFLNSMEIIKYEIDDDSVIIYFNSDDYKINTKYLDKITSFLKKQLGDMVEIDISIENDQNELKTYEETFKKKLEKVTYLKKQELEKVNEFIEFCDFCDRTLACKLRPYQYKSAYFLSVLNGGFDFSVPGSGKTIISYATYNFFKHNNICDCILIIGPINSSNAWNDEFKTCFGNNPSFYSLVNQDIKDAKAYLLSSKSNHSEITFINNDKVWRVTDDIIEFCKNKKILLIVDEAHKAKNPTANISKSVMEISKYVCNRIILTGTPMPNGYEDLYSLTKIFSPYIKLIPYTYQELRGITQRGATNNQRKVIMESLSPVYSRVSKKYLLATGELLPPKYDIIICDFSVEQQLIYDFLNNIVQKLDNDLEFDMNINLMKAVVIRKMQVSANPSLISKSIVNSIEEYRIKYIDEYTYENSDTDRLIEADNYIKKLMADSSILKIVQKFENGQLIVNKNRRAVELALELVSKNYKVILWDIFVENMNALKYMFEQAGITDIGIVNGSVTGENRQKVLNNFRKGNCMVLIANPATLAESISLHKCCQYSIYVNRNFNAAQFIQSKDRIHRVNMPKGTTANYTFLINKESIDEEINSRLELKENRMLEILDSEEIIIGGNEFSSTDFMSDEDVKSSYRK